MSREPAPPDLSALGSGLTVAVPRLPVAPRYGSASLTDLLPSVLTALGVPGVPAIFSLPPSPRVVVLLVDGLGWLALQQHAAEAPFLSSLLAEGSPLTTGFPTTTSTSLTSLGTGLPPGEHGVLGFEMWLPEIDRPLNALRWDPDVDARALQPETTLFERAAADGVAVARVGPRAFDGSGLTEAASRGGSYVDAESPGERVAAAAHAVRRAERSLVYVYYGDLDSTGHRSGCTSQAWRLQLAHVDRLAEQLAAAMPADAMLLVTADHGMLDVPAAGRIDLATRPELDAGVRLMTGEPRVAYVHTVPGAEADVLDAWREELGETAWVLSRDEVVAAGWLGPEVRPQFRARLGDVVVAAREPIAIFDSRRHAEFRAVIGLHGSLTDAELLIPLLRHGPG
ncbi:MAG: alkaline phosphatase family protein [Actinomycetes bacterium]